MENCQVQMKKDWTISSAVTLKSKIQVYDRNGRISPDTRIITFFNGKNKNHEHRNIKLTRQLFSKYRSIKKHIAKTQKKKTEQKKYIVKH